MVCTVYRGADGRLYVSKRQTLVEATADVASQQGVVQFQLEGDENDEEFRQSVREYLEILGAKGFYKSVH